MFYYGSKISEHIVETPEGYLICMKVPINRIGTQKYRGSDIGLAGLDDNELYDVYREPEEVFSKISLASFEGKPVTDDHPVEDVDVNNYTIYEKGHGQNVSHDNEYSYADLYIKDPVLIEKIKNGKREISCGYECRFIIKDGKIYQTEIKGNHIAVVDNGRAGENVRINDSKEGVDNINQLSKQLEETNKKLTTILNKLNFAKKEDKRYWEQKIPQTYKELKNRLESIKSDDKYHNELENETKQDLKNIKQDIDRFSRTLTDSNVNDKDVDVKDNTEIQNIVEKYYKNGNKLSQEDFTKLKNSKLFSTKELENIMLGKAIGEGSYSNNTYDEKVEDMEYRIIKTGNVYGVSTDNGETFLKGFDTLKKAENYCRKDDKNAKIKYVNINDSKCEDELATYKFYEEKLKRMKEKPPAKFMYKALIENIYMNEKLGKLSEDEVVKLVKLWGEVKTRDSKDMSEYRQKIKDAVIKSARDTKLKDMSVPYQEATIRSLEANNKEHFSNIQLEELERMYNEYKNELWKYDKEYRDKINSYLKEMYKVIFIRKQLLK